MTEELVIREFFRAWQERLPLLVEGYIYDGDKNLYPTRYVFSRLKKLIEQFLADNLAETEKITIMPGIRGAGKTTLLMQIYSLEKFLKSRDASLLGNLNRLGGRLYLDVSRLRLEGIALNEFFQFYERVRDINLERLNEKYLILLDEVHYDNDWGLFLKNLFDRTKGHRNLLVIATGSSAVQLKINPDLSRRARIMEIYPMKFTEYLLLKSGLYPRRNLSDLLQEILFDAGDAQAVYDGLKSVRKQVDSFFAQLPPGVEQQFFTTGSFPFSVVSENAERALAVIKNVLNSIMVKDIITFEKFRTQTVSKLQRLLYLIASSDVISYDNLRTTLKIERYETLESLIEALITSGVLLKVPSIGKPYTSTRKTPKLLFTAPALRAAVLDNMFRPNVEGKKLEDYFGLVYMNDLKDRFGATLAYDLAEGGADFVLRSRTGEPVVIELGFNKEETRQVENTLRKVRGRYGIIFGARSLELIGETIVKVPLTYLLLL